LILHHFFPEVCGAFVARRFARAMFCDFSHVPLDLGPFFFLDSSFRPFIDNFDAIKRSMAIVGVSDVIAIYRKSTLGSFRKILSIFIDSIEKPIAVYRIYR
jgi:hypothetical protein